MHFRIATLSFALALCASAPASAQSVYVDIEGIVTLPTPPPASYGAAAFRPGQWNAVGNLPTWGYTQSLFDVDGISSGLTLQSFCSGDCFCSKTPTGASGDEAALMDDYLQDFGLCGIELQVHGLAPGDYRVYTYAWGHGYTNEVFVTPSNDPSTVLNGITYPGSLQLGFTHAVQRVRNLASGQPLRIVVTPWVGCGGSEGAACQGFQILKTPGETFCAGDGLDASVTSACPCLNYGTQSHGCASSVNPAGALLDSFGTVATDSVQLASSGMPSSATAVYLQGDALTDAVFGDGILCAGGSLVRLRVRTSVAGASAFPDASDTITLSQRGGVTVGSGATRIYQTYYRNAAIGFCGPATFNSTNAVRVVW